MCCICRCSTYFESVAESRRELKKAGGKERACTDFQRDWKHQNHLAQSGHNNERKERSEETQESYCLAVLKPKYRKKEHSKKLKPSWKTPLTHHSPWEFICLVDIPEFSCWDHVVPVLSSVRKPLMQGFSVTTSPVQRHPSQFCIAAAQYAVFVP